MLTCCINTQLVALAAGSFHAAAVLVAEGLLEKMPWAAQATPVHSHTQLACTAGMLAIRNELLDAADDVAQQSAAAEAPKAATAVAVADAATATRARFDSSTAALAQAGHTAPPWLPPTRRLAVALLAWWRHPKAQPAAALELAQAAAARSCAYLRCANLGGEGGPAAGQGAGSLRCRWAEARVQGNRLICWMM